jgi:hypothetical protein
MTQMHDELVNSVLQCANRAAGTTLSLPPDRDMPMEAFAFDSLSLFVFLLELERITGMKFDDTLLAHERLGSIQSVAALIRGRTPPWPVGPSDQPPAT